MCCCAVAVAAVADPTIYSSEIALIVAVEQDKLATLATQSSEDDQHASQIVACQTAGSLAPR